MKSMGRTPGGSGCKEAKGGGGSATSEDSSVGEGVVLWGWNLIYFTAVRLLSAHPVSLAFLSSAN